MKNNFFFKKQFSNIYKKASKNSEVTSQILYGEKFKILSKNKGWVKIKSSFDNYTGYIKNKDYVEKLSPNYKVYSLKAKIFIVNSIRIRRTEVSTALTCLATLPARVGTQQPRGPEYPTGRRLWRPRTLRPVRPGCPGGCSRSNSRLTGTPSPVGAGGVRSSSRHPAGRHTPPWKLVLEGVQAMSSGSHPWTSQTLATGLLPFLPGWALRRVWPGRSVAAEVVPRGHVHVCV